MAQPQTNPGKVFGIIGFIFAFVFLGVPGLILSIIGLTKSKHAGYRNGLAIAGIVLNSLSIIGGFIAILSIITIVAYNGVTQKASDANALNNAQDVQKVAEAINADMATYPYSPADFQTEDVNVKLPTSIIVVNDPSQLNSGNGTTTVAYLPGPGATEGSTLGATIYYWDFMTSTDDTIQVGQ